MNRKFLLIISLVLVFALFNSGQSSIKVGARVFAPVMQRTAGPIRFTPRQISEANRRLRYTIKAKYPQAIGAARDARLTKLNQELRSLITAEVKEFKSYFDEPQEQMGPSGSTYDSAYWVTLSTPNLVSLAFGISTYGEGAAHPNHNTMVFNYDLDKGRTLSLSELFKPNSNYLKVISNYTINELKKKFAPDPDLDWIENGAGAKEENYKNWNLTKSGLQVTFDPYQVASYAEGEHVVVIPYAVLKDLIDPQGPLPAIAWQQKGTRK